VLDLSVCFSEFPEFTNLFKNLSLLIPYAKWWRGLLSRKRKSNSTGIQQFLWIRREKLIQMKLFSK
jgi:hypothetical protein